MRLKSGIWVAAYLRRNEVEGRYGAVLRKGAAEAGAVYVIVNRLDGTARLFGPPPGPSHDDDGRRRFAEEAAGPMAEIETALARRARIDPDIWVVEIEDRGGDCGTPT